MKLNWGFGITISIIVFTLISIGFIFLAFNQDVNLVRDDYYEAEVKHNDKIKRIERANNLIEKLEIQLSNNEILLQFPSTFERKGIRGDILLYRPSNRENDVKLKIELDSMNTQKVSKSNLLKGLWKIEIEWNLDSLSFFNDKILMVQ